MVSVLNSVQKKEFDQKGFVLIRNFFDKEETSLLQQASYKDKNIKKHFYDRKDSEGLITKMVAWNHPDDSIYGTVARSYKMVDTMEHLLGGEVYHYHSKITAKEPFEGGAWEWHQDYGYWYKNGCLYPYLASCWIALNRADKSNGCMQVIKGSHHAGRIEYHIDFGQNYADPEQVEQLINRQEIVFCELDPGSALFFHCNVLHRSDANTSNRNRWNLICCYNAARNNPYKAFPHLQYTPLEKVSDTDIKEIGLKLSVSSDSFYKSDQGVIRRGHTAD